MNRESWVILGGDFVCKAFIVFLGLIFSLFLNQVPYTYAGEKNHKQNNQNLSDFRRVVVARSANAVQKVAAEELAHYVGLITGKPLEIILDSEYKSSGGGLNFFVGSSAAEKLLGLNLGRWKEEEFLLLTVPQGLVVAGDDGSGDPWSKKTRAGSLLAVYVLLDDYLGVRWFWPGPFGEHVPRAPTVEIPSLNLRATPKLSIRWIGMGYSNYHLPSFREAARKWARRSRLAWTRSAVFGHSWSSEFKEDFSRHPEWFALVKGKRRPPQMCSTHPEVIERMVERVLKGKTRIVNISPSDGAGFCECDEQTKSEIHKKLGLPSCTSLDVPGPLSYDNKTPLLSDRIFTYANEIARRVRLRDPDKTVGMHAYTFYNRPPRKIKRLEPNIYISFVFQSAGHRDAAALAEWRESVKDWKRLGAKLIMREGWGNHYYLDLPFLHYNQIIANFTEAYTLGFEGSYGDGSKCFATQAPNYWAITKMMWDPERKTTTLMDDFFRDAYGPVANEMRAFFETYNKSLNENWAKRRRLVDTNKIAYANIISSWHLILPRQVVQEADEHLRAAEKKVPPGEYADRVAFHRLGQDYTALMLELLDIYRQLAKLRVNLDWFTSKGVQNLTDGNPSTRLLKHAYELGEKREQMLLKHRDWAAMCEGMYAFTNDRKKRQWHAAVKQALGINSPSALTWQTLKKN
jgi:hypothetical protein